MKDWSVEAPCIHAEDDLCLALKWPHKTDSVRVPGCFFSDCGAVHTKAPDEVLVGRLFFYTMPQASYCSFYRQASRMGRSLQIPG